MTEPIKRYAVAVAVRLIVIWAPAVFCICLWHHGDPWLAVAIFFGVFFILLHADLSPTSTLFGPVTKTIPDAPAQPPGVWLTLDDGPDPVTTPQVLEMLAGHRAHAIFFLIGRKARQHPELVRAILERGHVIGNHSETHPTGRFWLLGPRQTWREIAECQKTLAEITDAPVSWFRAPVGHYNVFTHPAAAAMGLRIMSWSCRGLDGVDRNVGRILQRIAKTLKPGGIVLVHEATEVSAEVLKGTLALLQERGLVIIPPPDALPR